MSVHNVLLARAFLSAAEPLATVTLTNSPSRFPTHSTQVIGCPAVYDSPRGKLPAGCFPYPVTMEITHLEHSNSGNRLSVVEVQVTNTGSGSISLPKATAPTNSAGQQSFFSFFLYDSPGAAGIPFAAGSGICFGLQYLRRHHPPSVMPVF